MKSSVHADGSMGMDRLISILDEINLSKYNSRRMTEPTVLDSKQPVHLFGLI